MDQWVIGHLSYENLDPEPSHACKSWTWQCASVRSSSDGQLYIWEGSLSEEFSRLSRSVGMHLRFSGGYLGGKT